MVNINELNPGDRIKIVDKWNYDSHENPDGKMDKYLGSVVTVREISNGAVRICEDQLEWDNGWYWFPGAIERVIDFCDRDDFKLASDEDILDLL